MKWTRQRCQVAVKILETAALMPSWASETTSLTPRRPRRASLLQRRRYPVHGLIRLGNAYRTERASSIWPVTLMERCSGPRRKRKPTPKRHTAAFCAFDRHGEHSDQS
jgi:hypothetical protein